MAAYAPGAYLAPLPGVVCRGTLEGRFSKKVLKAGENECWIWVGAKGKKGYGSFFAGGKVKPAHRVAYAMAFGDFPEEMHVLHRCDNPSCVNPTHLFLGSNADNVADRVVKGRSGRKSGINSGETNGRARLTLAQAMAIKNETGKTLQELGEAYGVSSSAVWLIRTGKKWASAISRAEQAFERKARAG